MKTVLFKRLLPVLFAWICFSDANAQTATFSLNICNCNTFSCTAVITVSIRECADRGMTNCSWLTPVTQTITPGSCQTYTWNLTFPHYIDYTSATFTVTSGSYSATFGTSTTTDFGNCYDPTGTNCGVTHWTAGTGLTSYTICPDFIVGTCRRANPNEGSISAGGEVTAGQTTAIDQPDIGIKTATGIKLITNVSTFDLYPNPAHGETNISFALEKPETIQIEIYDITGTKVYSTEKAAQAGSSKITVNTLGTGMYYVMFKSAGGTITRKLLIQE